MELVGFPAVDRTHRPYDHASRSARNYFGGAFSFCGREVSVPIITQGITIEAPVEFVFSFLANFENHPHFEYGVTKFERLTTGPTDIGTRFR